MIFPDVLLAYIPFITGTYNRSPLCAPQTKEGRKKEINVCLFSIRNLSLESAPHKINPRYHAQNSLGILLDVIACEDLRPHGSPVGSIRLFLERHPRLLLFCLSDPLSINNKAKHLHISGSCSHRLGSKSNQYKFAVREPLELPLQLSQRERERERERQRSPLSLSKTQSK